MRSGRWASATLMLSCLVLGSPGAAEDRGTFSSPELRADEAQEAARGEAAQLEPQAPRTEQTPPKSAWRGPRVALAYRYYRLDDFSGGGAVHGAAFSGFLPTGWLRAGGGVDAAARSYDYGKNGAILAVHAFAGYQHLRDLAPVVPYAVLQGSAGVLFSKRFHTPLTDPLFGVGVECGASANLVRTLHLGLGVGFMHHWLNGLRYNSFALRVAVGL